MRKVNPPLFNQVPKSPQTLNYFTNINTILNQIYEKLRGQVDPIQEALEVNGDITSAGFQTFICTNTTAITITLNTRPSDGETVHVKVRDAQGTISGAIDGTTSLVLATQYDSATLVYLSGEWSVI
jgi:hypothetical protein